MQFYATLISLYRPYMSTRILRSADDSVSPGDRETLRDIPSECVGAAHQVAELLRCYQRQHSLRRMNVQIVHIIFTASLIFAYDVCTRQYNDARPSLQDLQFCCHALGEIGQCYGNAMRALEVIILVKSEWQRRITAHRPFGGNGVKRRTISRPGGEHRSKRRQRPSASSSDVTEPSSFNAFQMLCDDYIGQFAYTSMPDAGDVQTTEEFLDNTGFDVGDLVPPVGWPVEAQSGQIISSGIVGEKGDTNPQM